MSPEKLEITLRAIQAAVGRFDGMTLAERRGDYTPRWMRYREVRAWRRQLEAGDYCALLQPDADVWGWNQFTALVLEVRGSKVRVLVEQPEPHSYVIAEELREAWVPRYMLAPRMPNGWVAHKGRVMREEEVPVSRWEVSHPLIEEFARWRVEAMRGTPEVAG